MINPERERKRLEAADAAARAERDKGMAHPGADMVRVFSVAGFELADVFAEWSSRANAEALAEGYCGAEDMLSPDRLKMLAGLGTPWPVLHEDHKAYGDRVARAILKLIKEV